MTIEASQYGMNSQRWITTASPLRLLSSQPYIRQIYKENLIYHQNQARKTIFVKFGQHLLMYLIDGYHHISRSLPTSAALALPIFGSNVGCKHVLIVS